MTLFLAGTMFEILFDQISVRWLLHTSVGTQKNIVRSAYHQKELHTISGWQPGGTGYLECFHDNNIINIYRFFFYLHYGNLNAASLGIGAAE